MPRPRTPTKVLELRGAYRKNPKRALDRANEPRPTSPIGDPPAEFLNEFSQTAKRHLRIWYELIAQDPGGVLTGSDRIILQSACRIQAAIEQGDRSPAMFGQLKGHLSEMGMTPAGRSKTAGPKPKGERGENPYEALARETSRRA
jgi:hypothetical protein